MGYYIKLIYHTKNMIDKNVLFGVQTQASFMYSQFSFNAISGISAMKLIYVL